jgi:hypothetical protein
LANGTISSQSIAPLTASIQALSNGWYRCVVSATTAASPVASTLVLQLNNGVTTSYTGDGTSGLFLWGAQLEQSSTVGEYIPTTSTINSAPRFDHNPTTGESLGLLVEESRTNLLLQSEDFSTTWVNTTSTESVNAETSPNGSLTADKLIPDSGSSDGQVRQDLSKSGTATTYTFSCFAKKAEFNRTILRVEHNGTTANRAEVTFSLDNGSTTSAAQSFGTFSSASSSSQALSNGWYRFSLTFTSSTETSLRVRIYAADSAATGDGTSGIYLWGAQLEAASFPTSYIPTTTATVTRAADVASITGANFSSWYRQDEGTVFANAVINGFTVQNFVYVADAGVDYFNSHNLYTTNGNLQLEAYVAGAAQCTLQPSPGISPSSGSLFSVSYAYKQNDFAASRNGSAVAADNAGNLPTCSRLLIGSNGSVYRLNGTIRRLTYWPSRLPNTTLQQITQ